MNTTLSATATVTRQNLIDSFWLLYCQKNIEKITVKEICEIAGYNRSTFYVYFNDVYEILEEIEEQTITVEDFRSIVIKNLFYGNLFRDHRKKAILKSILEFFEKKQNLSSGFTGRKRRSPLQAKSLKETHSDSAVNVQKTIPT
ncbi:TetR/AcrR family transcriptional regulator [Acetobacterium wieringae]|uniref:TetR/AcrR family transcriptional regulator n=1 Tax=Acetobacterium wieringae TaxID=52694 RepID=UPI002034316D|nr:TetR/AcrR family transcriptional regulator [Acetobacterium wieringae]URN86257.1 TetR/AcrR family transcriptional regulator [Acetobacterium wieringae]